MLDLERMEFLPLVCGLWWYKCFIRRTTRITNPGSFWKQKRIQENIGERLGHVWRQVEKSSPEFWSVVKRGSRDHKRKFFSKWSAVVQFWRLWGPSWFCQTTNLTRLSGFWIRVSSSDFFFWWSSWSLLQNPHQIWWNPEPTCLHVGQR